MKNPDWNGDTPGETDEKGRSEWLLTGYTRDVRSGEGTMQTEVWSDMKYNEFGNLSSYTRVSTDFQGRPITTSWTGSYDEYDRVASYSQTIKDDFGHVQTLEFSGATYNTTDDLLSYVEEVTEDGKTKGRSFGGAAYDSKHNLVGSYEKTYEKTEDGQKIKETYRDWSSQGVGMGYNSRGELLGYREVLSYDQMTIETTVTGITYDAMQRRSGGFEARHTYGVESNGAKVDVKELIDTQRVSEQVSEKVIVLNAKLNITMKIKLVTDYAESKVIQGWDSSSGELIRTLKEEHTVRSDISAAGAFREIKRITGEHGDLKLDTTTETRRSDMVYDGFGRVVSLVEETIQNNEAATWSKRETTGMIYDVFGNLLQSHEESVNALGVKTVADRLNMTYDPRGRLSSYEIVSTSEAEGIRSGSRVVRDHIAYNGLGDVAEYFETVTREGLNVIEAIHWKGQYNALGQLSQSWQETHRTGTAVDETGEMRSLDTTDITVTTGMSYNLDGSLKGYTEENTSTATPELTTINIMEGATYDDFGRLASYRLTTHKVSRNADGQHELHTITVTERIDAIFDDQGALQGYKEIVTLTNGAGVPAGGSTTVRSDIVFHPMGQILSYTDAVTRSESPGITAMVHWQGSYDIYGRMSGFFETRTDTNPDGTLGLEVRTERTGIEYDLLGQVIRYTETTNRSDAPGMTTEKTWEALSYDSNGNLTGTRETIHSLGIGLDTTKTYTRTGMTYNGLGQLETYVEEQRDSSTPDLTTMVERLQTTYDDFGREIGTVEVQHTFGQGTETLSDGTVRPILLDTTKTNVREGTTYNAAGLVTGYRDVQFDGREIALGRSPMDWLSLSPEQKKAVLSGTLRAGELVTLTEKSGLVYNKQGLATHYTEKTRELSTTLDRTRTSARADVVYSNLNQMLSYSETLQDSSTPGLTERIAFSGAVYNDLGQMIGSLERRESIGPDFSNVTITVRQNLRYDSAGRLIHEETRQETAGGLATVRVWDAVSFNGLGQSTGFTETVQQTGQAADGSNLDLTTTTTRYDMQYDTFGRLVGYQENRVSSDKPDVSVNVQWQSTGFNSNNQMTGFVETRQETNPQGTNQTTTERSLIQYNRNGQLISYTEDITNSADSVTETVNWKAQGYNSVGQLTGFEETRRRFAQDVLNVTTTITRSGMQYDSAGNLIAYHQETRGTDNPDLRQSSDWTGTYNNLGQLSSFREVNHTSDAVNGALNTTTVVERSNIHYNSIGQMVGYSQNTTDALGQVSQTEWVGTYDGRGLLSSFKERTTDSRGNLTVREQKDITYDAAGRLSGYHETVQQLGQAENGADLDLTTTTTRYDMQYDAYGRLASYEEDRVSSDKPDVSVNVLWQSTGYNSNNQMTGFVETRRETSPQGVYQTTTARDEIQYNRLGQMDSYQDTLTNNADSVTETVHWQALGYNSLGQLTGFEETRRKFAPDLLDVTTTLTRSDMRYDSVGNLIGYHQEIQGTDNPDLRQSVDWTGTYNNLGQLTSYREVNHSYDVVNGTLDTTTVVERSNILYNRLGQMVGYSQNTTDALGLVTHTDWVGTYDRRGLLASFEERTTDPRGNLTVRSQMNITYDAAGRLYGFEETVTDPLGVVTTTRRMETHYNAAGQVLGYTDSIVTVDAEGNRTETLTVR
ncbi:MAG: hypothetical protein HY548_09490, partial [Elusimicrobia bacterium]|nr:hypothetical protein [Elusimicrobiota bacterium]